jgi:hypothetical protein
MVTERIWEEVVVTKFDSHLPQWAEEKNENPHSIRLVCWPSFEPWTFKTQSRSVTDSTATFSL